MLVFIRNLFSTGIEQETKEPTNTNMGIITYRSGIHTKTQSHY